MVTVILASLAGVVMVLVVWAITPEVIALVEAGTSIKASTSNATPIIHWLAINAYTENITVSGSTKGR